MCKRITISLFLATFFIVVLFTSTAQATGGCVCYNSASEAQSVDGTEECKTDCGDAAASISTKGQCVCPDGTPKNLTCETTCTAAGFTTTAGATPAKDEGNKTATITPILNVNIPTIDLTDAISTDGKTLHINFISVYIAGFYKYLISLSTIAAIVMIMIGGLQYAAAGGYGDTTKAKTRIKNAVIGLVLLMSTYLILWTINPELVALRTISLENIAEDALEDLVLEGCKDLEGTISVCSVQILTTPSGWDASLTALVNEIAIAEGVDPIQLATHLQIETSGTISYDKTKRGPCGEIGVAQFMPSSFESTVGQECCVRVAAKSSSTGESVGKVCDEGLVTGWPPDSTQFPNCASDICGNCQVARDSCAEYFDTDSADGLRNTISAQAKFVKRKMDRTGDLALAMCAYNGSGTQAAHYAQKAGEIYLKFCQASGG